MRVEPIEFCFLFILGLVPPTFRRLEFHTIVAVSVVGLCRRPGLRHDPGAVQEGKALGGKGRRELLEKGRGDECVFIPGEGPGGR